MQKLTFERVPNPHLLVLYTKTELPQKDVDLISTVRGVNEIETFGCRPDYDTFHCGEWLVHIFVSRTETLDNVEHWVTETLSRITPDNTPEFECFTIETCLNHAMLIVHLSVPHPGIETALQRVLGAETVEKWFNLQIALDWDRHFRGQVQAPSVEKVAAEITKRTGLRYIESLH